MIVGHDKVQAAFKQGLPTTALLLGPASVGKRTLINHYVRKHGIFPSDAVKPVLTPETARDLHRFFGTAPFGPSKVAILNLDRASSASLNVLLKLLEEPPKASSFLMFATNAPLLTIQSRAMTLRCNYLSDEEVYQVLVARFAMEPQDARTAASLSGGQISKALESPDIMTTKSPVLSVLKATAEGNEPLFYNALTKWGAQEHKLFCTWAIEARTARWSVFTPEESFGLTKDSKLIERINKALRTGARPRIAVKLALMDILESRR